MLREMKRQAARVRDRGRLGRWWTAVYVLMGLRYEDELVEQLLQGVLDMEESTTYQAIIRKGRTEGALEEARKLLLRMGQRQFQTEAPAEVQTRVEAMQDLEQREQLLLQVPQSHSWDELLPPPKPRRRKSTRR